MKVKFLKFNAYTESPMIIEDRINSFTSRMEIIDIKMSTVTGDRYDQVYLYVLVLYK